MALTLSARRPAREPAKPCVSTLGIGERSTTAASVCRVGPYVHCKARNGLSDLRQRVYGEAVPAPLVVSFVGGAAGAWHVEQIVAVVGAGLPLVSRVNVVEGLPPRRPIR